MSTTKAATKKFPQYTRLRFPNRPQFESWLERTAHYKIEFEDNHQDFLTWYIDGGGEVLHCEPFQASVWNGSIVKMEDLLECGQVCIRDRDDANRFVEMKHGLRMLTELKPMNVVLYGRTSAKK